MTSILAANVKTLRARLNLNQQAFAERLKVQQPYISKWEAGTVTPSGDSIAAMAALARCSYEAFQTQPLPAGYAPPPPTPTDTSDGDFIEMVGIQHIDMEYGLGATFADGHVDVEVLKFPQVWVRTITHSPPELLTWTRGRGDSMQPTIHDGALVMLDRSQRVIREPDALWAFTVGETAAIKRLRLKGDRVQIFSDNSSVPPDEEPLSMVNIVGRVVFVGSRK